MLRDGNPIVRGITLEIHRDGSSRLELHSPHAAYMLGVRHGRRRGGRARVWWLMDAQGNPDNPNFKPGIERARTLATLLRGALDAAEADAKAAEVADGYGSVSERISRLERELESLRRLTESATQVQPSNESTGYVAVSFEPNSVVKLPLTTTSESGL